MMGLFFTAVAVLLLFRVRLLYGAVVPTGVSNCAKYCKYCIYNYIVKTVPEC